MPRSEYRPTDRIESLDAVCVAATRLIDWFRSGPPVPSLLSTVPREQLPANLLGLALGKTSAPELERALTTFSASHVRGLGNREFGRWPNKPFHCGGCAEPYQKIINEVIDLATSTNPSELLAAELSSYDHLTLAQVIERERLDWPFRVEFIFDYLATKHSSPVGTILHRLRAEHRAYREEQLAIWRADLVRRVETSVSDIAGRVNDMPPEQLRSALEATFVIGQLELNSYISWHGKPCTGNVFERLQSVYEPASTILPAALRLATSTRSWPLISTLLVILRSESHACPELMVAALECKKRGAVLELINRGAPPPPGPASTPPARHLERIRQHAEDNEALRRFRLELEAMNPQDRLRCIALDDQWPVAAFPTHYADTEAALTLPEMVLARLMTRLARVPRGAWAKLRSQVSQAKADRQ